MTCLCCGFFCCCFCRGLRLILCWSIPPLTENYRIIQHRSGTCLPSRLASDRLLRLRLFREISVYKLFETIKVAKAAKVTGKLWLIIFKSNGLVGSQFRKSIFVWFCWGYGLARVTCRKIGLAGSLVRGKCWIVELVIIELVTVALLDTLGLIIGRPEYSDVR